MLRVITNEPHYAVNWLKSETLRTEKKDDSKSFFLAIYLDLSNYDCEKPVDDMNNGRHEELMVVIDSPFSSWQEAMDEMERYSKHVFSEIESSSVINQAIPSGFYMEYFDVAVMQFAE